jgi:hypothetical protein
VVVNKGRVSLRDLGSSNGTFVNGVWIDGFRLLQVDDRIDIGPFARRRSHCGFRPIRIAWAGSYAGPDGGRRAHDGFLHEAFARSRSAERRAVGAGRAIVRDRYGDRLVLSAVSSSTDQASTLIPIALIPQILLGVIVPDLPGMADFMAIRCC